MNKEKAKEITQKMKELVEKDKQLNINLIRVIVALERAVARLERNRQLAEHLIFKGGFVLLKSYESPRFTLDVDALAISIGKDKLKDLVSSSLTADFDDGLWYGDVRIKELTEQGEYGAYRFDAAFQIGEPSPKKLSHYARIHIDVSFNDRLPDKSVHQVMNTLLGLEERVTWKIYPAEHIIAEKIQTLFDRGSANSRAKDIYDLLHLFPRCKNHQAVIEAIKKTFKNRETILPESFEKQVSQFDKTVLEKAWPGIQVWGEKPTFGIAWSRLMEWLRALGQG